MQKRNSVNKQKYNINHLLYNVWISCVSHQRLRPRTLDPATRTRISGGPNIFIFFTKRLRWQAPNRQCFFIFFTKRWRQGPSLPVLVLKPAVIATITVGCSNRHRRTNSLSVFKLKRIVMCRFSSHTNSASMTTTVATLLPPTPTTLVQKKNVPQLLTPIKWPSARS